jgi:hypothetical protein
MLESTTTATHETSSTSARSRRRMVPAEAIILVTEAATIAVRTRVRLRPPRAVSFQQANPQRSVSMRLLPTDQL